jgi:hypothetical protein
MTDFQALKDLVKKKGFGTALYGNVTAKQSSVERNPLSVFR